VPLSPVTRSGCPGSIIARMLDVAIVGAGPGGAAAANAITRAAPHLKVKVFERASNLRRVGFAVMIAVSSPVLSATTAFCSITNSIVRRATA
jgi:2-polyprenyl-6-methoxyphenol hydroxylase-like FAD-dependent oxidoreductase